METDLRSRVALGAALLDREYGLGWRGIVAERGRLSVGAFRQCVLAKLLGTYHDGVMGLFADKAGTRGKRTERQREQAIAHGFACDRDVNVAQRIEQYRELTRLWEAEIDARLELSERQEG